MNLRRIDFFLCVVLFLYFMIAVFYIDDARLMRRSLLFYTAEMALLLLLFVSGLHVRLNSMFAYATDVLALLLFAAVVLFIRLQAGAGAEVRRKQRQAMAVSLATPLVLVPVFRFLLRVPLPYEGGIVNLMSLGVYALRRIGG